MRQQCQFILIIKVIVLLSKPFVDPYSGVRIT